MCKNDQEQLQNKTNKLKLLQVQGTGNKEILIVGSNQIRKTSEA